MRVKLSSRSVLISLTGKLKLVGVVTLVVTKVSNSSSKMCVVVECSKL